MKETFVWKQYSDCFKKMYLLFNSDCTDVSLWVNYPDQENHHEIVVST